ncbi:hypothetical protein [Oceaniradius stylonematis]|uniref:hypothetical protein n=1 Tax=Oceaniradius stylonematis TaxID=2184161 RepID=UPI0035D0F19E
MAEGVQSTANSATFAVLAAERLADKYLAWITALSAGWFVWYIAVRLDVGVDVSDGAYYIISYARHQEVTAQATLAGWLWAGFSPFEGIVANRYLSLAATVGAFVMLAASLVAYAGRTDRTGSMIALGLCVGGGLIYYFYWFVDPSYNSVTLVFIALCWAAVLALVSATRRAYHSLSRVEAIWAFAVGAVVAGTVFAKASSALLLGATALLFYVLTSWRSITAIRLAGLAGASMLGLAVPFAVFALAGESPERAIRTFSEGVALAWLLTSPSADPITPLFHFFGDVLVAPVIRSWALLPFAMLVFLAVLGPALARRGVGFAVRFGLSISLTGLFVLAVLLNVGGSLRPAANALMVLTLLLAFLAAPTLDSGQRTKALFLVFGMAGAAAAYANGTGNAWSFQLIGAMGFPFAAIAAVVSAMRAEERNLWTLPALGLLVCSFWVTARAIETEPYRLEPPMSDMQSVALVGPYSEPIRELVEQAEFYNRLAEFKPLVADLPRRPLLIDLTGRVPVVAYQIGARIPGTPWLLSGYPGSGAFFDAMIGNYDEMELAEAWVFQTDDYARSHPNTALGAFGLSFPDDYLPLVTVPVPYMGFEATLYAPKHVLSAAERPKTRSSAPGIQ